MSPNLVGTLINVDRKYRPKDKIISAVISPQIVITYRAEGLRNAFHETNFIRQYYTDVTENSI